MVQSGFILARQHEDRTLQFLAFTSTAIEAYTLGCNGHEPSERAMELLSRSFSSHGYGSFRYNDVQFRIISTAQIKVFLHLRSA